MRGARKIRRTRPRISPEPSTWLGRSGAEDTVIALLPAFVALAQAGTPIPAQFAVGEPNPAGPRRLTQEPVPTSSTDEGSSFGDEERAFLMETNLRFRYLSVPSSIMDIWYFDSDDPGANDFDRPKVRGVAVGFEYVLKAPPVNWIFYYEYIGSLIKEGYWDDVEEPADHEDGDWIKPDGFGIHAIGANYGHSIPVTPDDRPVWLSLMFGGGLGIGFASGELQEWNPGSNPDITSGCLTDPPAPAYERHSQCKADGVKRMPSVVPILDLTASARVNFDDKANVRLDLGLHDMLYIGGAAGAVF